MDKPSHPIGLQAFVKFKGSVLDMQDRNYFEVNPLIPNVIYIVSKRIRL
jgi:hypothetical protein